LAPPPTLFPYTTLFRSAVLQEARRVLRPGGRFVSMQPNIRYEPAKYWDFYDHLLPLSHLSAEEAFAKNGYRVESVIPRFVPFSRSEEHTSELQSPYDLV